MTLKAVVPIFHAKDPLVGYVHVHVHATVNHFRTNFGNYWVTIVSYTLPARNSGK